MFNLTGSEIIVILLLALVILGPEKLPDAIRRFGRTYAELKKMSTGFQQEFKSAMDEPMKEMRETADLLRKSADFGSVNSSASVAAAASKRQSPGGPTDQTATDHKVDEPAADADAAELSTPEPASTEPVTDEGEDRPA